MPAESGNKKGISEMRNLKMEYEKDIMDTIHGHVLIPLKSSISHIVYYWYNEYLVNELL